MGKKDLTRDDVIALLKAKQGDRTVTAFAEEFGVSTAYMSDVLRGNRSLGPGILGPLGLVAETEVTYRKVA